VGEAPGPTDNKEEVKVRPGDVGHDGEKQGRRRLPLMGKNTGEGGSDKRHGLFIGARVV
jgi:hypothetical protein